MQNVSRCGEIFDRSLRRLSLRSGEPFGSLYQDRVTEFVSPISVRLELLGHMRKHPPRNECAQQLVMARTALMRPGQNRVNDS